MSGVRSLPGQRPERGPAKGRVGATVQLVQRAYRPPPERRAPRGVRDPWLVIGAVVVAVVAVGWRNNPPVPGATAPLALRSVSLVVAALPVLALLAWLSAVLRTRPGGGGWGPPTLVGLGGLWVVVLTTVLVLHGGAGAACEGVARCGTSSGSRLVLAVPLAASWGAGRLLDGAWVKRRAGVQWRSPTSDR